MREEIKAAIDRYVETGCPLGGFLTAVMENDLMEAFSRGDEDNLAHMREIMQYVYMDIPGNCHGSPERVSEWYARHREGKMQSRNGRE